MAQQYLLEQRRTGTVAEIAALKFPFPDDASPNLETVLNVPDRKLAAGEYEGRQVFPDIVVVRRPGLWLQIMAQVESAETINEETARTRWLPASLLGSLILYVPVGQAADARRLCKKLGIAVSGIRTWRFRPVWGLEVTEA